MTELLEKAKQGDKTARMQFAEKNLGLVHCVVKRFSDRELEEDLFQIGCVGLMKAIDRFDFSFQVQFSTFAVPYIAGEIKMYLRDQGMIKVSRTRRALGQAIRREEEKWRQTYKKEPRLTDIAKMLHISPEEAAAAISSLQSVDSLDRPMGEENITLGDTIACEDDIEAVLGAVFVQQALKSLSERERNIILLRFFEKKTQQETAEALLLSQVQISRLEKEILKKLRMNQA
ncbi:MAG: sigma-70 family RNA polymerase sigma factor [Clostridia bacterium]|nr:sigma-70 family RNA polymerase sigma factor [Clostridia bacterium]